MKQSTAVFQGSSGALTPTVTPCPASCSGLHLGLQYMGDTHSINTDIHGATFPQCPSPHILHSSTSFDTHSNSNWMHSHVHTSSSTPYCCVPNGQKSETPQAKTVGIQCAPFTHTQTRHSYSYGHVCTQHMHPFCYV